MCYTCLSSLSWGWLLCKGRPLTDILDPDLCFSNDLAFCRVLGENVVCCSDCCEWGAPIVVIIFEELAQQFLYLSIQGEYFSGQPRGLCLFERFWKYICHSVLLVFLFSCGLVVFFTCLLFLWCTPKNLPLKLARSLFLASRSNLQCKGVVLRWQWDQVTEL